MKILHGAHELVKICADCRTPHVGLPAIFRAFHKDPSRSDGLKIYCKACRRAARKYGSGR